MEDCNICFESVPNAIVCYGKCSFRVCVRCLLLLDRYDFPDCSHCGQGYTYFKYNGMKYQGKVVDNIPNDSNGKLFIGGPDVFCFEGPIVDGKPNGSGKITLYNGYYTEAEMHSLCLNGEYTVYNDSHAGKVIKCAYKDGKQLGGKITYPEGTSYTGEMKNFLPDGRGILSFPGMTYDGSFRNGRFHGVGMIYRDGLLVGLGNFINDIQQI
jgi:hypothetical protein